MKQSVQAVGLPLIRFGVFYEEDLDIAPGPRMDFYGPVHANGNLYLSCNDSTDGLVFHDRFTAHGDVFRGRKDSDDILGIVNINDVSDRFSNAVLQVSGTNAASGKLEYAKGAAGHDEGVRCRGNRLDQDNLGRGRLVIQVAVRISSRMPRAVCGGSSACRMGRPTTIWLAPALTAISGVATRF